MESTRRPEVVREKISRVGGGRLSCALIFDREFSRDEISRFYSQRSEDRPASTDFEVAGRMVRYDCSEADEAKWRLAVEILLVKSFREAAPRQTDRDVRRRLGLHSLYR